MTGSIEVSLSLRLGSASNLLLYLVSMKAREEKTYSHKCVVANGMRKRTASSKIAGYSLHPKVQQCPASEGSLQCLVTVKFN